MGERNTPYYEVDLRTIQHLFSPFDNSLEVERITRLNAGMCNTNYRVFCKDLDHTFVLRIYTGEEGVCRKEQLLHKHMQNRVPIPAFRYCNTASASINVPYAVLDFIEGSSLSHLAAREPVSSTAIATQAGHYLAEIHQDKFATPGFFDLSFAVTSPIPPIPEWHQRFLDGVPANRMEDALRCDIQTFLSNNASFLRDIDPYTCLVHCDYRPDHILIEDGEIKAIIDWENALACAPLLDFGLFFRHGTPFTLHTEKAFLAAYEEHSNRKLPHQWRKYAALIDLAVMLQMLGSPLERPRLYTAYKTFIQHTLRHDFARHE